MICYSYINMYNMQYTLHVLYIFCTLYFIQIDVRNLSKKQLIIQCIAENSEISTLMYFINCIPLMPICRRSQIQHTALSNYNLLELKLCYIYRFPIRVTPK